MRLYREQEHNRRIAGKAEIVWGESTLAGRQRVERRSGLLIEKCCISPKMRVLEIGCGTGEYTLRLVQTGAMIFATDISEELLALAQNKGTEEKREKAEDRRQKDAEKEREGKISVSPCLCGRKGLNASFALCQAEYLPFKDNSFDAVVGNAVLHHLELPTALEEIKRVLKVGGRFAFTEPNMLNPQNMLIKNVKFLGRLLGESPDETAFFSWKILKQLKKAGFCEPMAQPFDFLHPIVPDSMVGIVSLLGKLMEKVYGMRNMAGSLIISGGKDAGSKFKEQKCEYRNHNRNYCGKG
ncbi:methyltransferase domain-containing protein [Candidatus Desantisbacteria bacterium]|nr:methyltransferase domain-containing protein [Candidatus Desantisbacteria bacterium]